MKDDKALLESLKGLYDSLTDEQKEKAKACTTADELMVLAGEEGIELPYELLYAAAGGFLFQDHGSQGIEIIRDSDGEYLGSVDTTHLAPGEIMEAARNAAIAKGQSPEWIYGWTALNSLRAQSQKKGC